MLAVFSLNFEATEGALYQMLNHGLSTGALFLCVGVLYERTHTRGSSATTAAPRPACPSSPACSWS